jgi:signal transduction histidine kinase
MSERPAAPAPEPTPRPAALQAAHLLLAAGVGAGLTLVWLGLSLAGAAWLNGSWYEGMHAVADSKLLLMVFALGLVLVGTLSWWFVRRHETARHVERLALSQERELLELLPFWYWETDANHRLTRLRPPAQAPAGHWQVRHRLGLPLWEDFWSEAGTWDAHRQMLEAQQPFTALPAHRREENGRISLWLLSGRPRFDARGRFAGYRGTARDVSARVELQFDRQIGLHLIDTVPSAVLLAEADDEPQAPYRIRQVNEMAARCIGQSASLLPGQPLVEVVDSVPYWPRSALQSVLGETAAPPEPPAEGSRPWEMRVDPFEFEHGGARRRALLVVCTPAASAVDESAQSERLAVQRELESFSYTVSHDLRAPIRVVEGFAKILKEDYAHALDRIGNDHLDRVLGAAARMNGMIDALLALSQLTAKPLAMQPVNLSQLAQYIIEDLRRQAPQRRAELEIQEGLVVQGDPTLLRVLLENLLGNAWKYSARSDPTRIVLRAVQERGRWIYQVRDNGAGFDMRFADRLFGVFQRLHSANDFPGTGVGLATVQRIVRRHGGQIWAESEVGAGACFYFTLHEAAASNPLTSPAR